MAKCSVCGERVGFWSGGAAADGRPICDSCFKATRKKTDEAENSAKQTQPSESNLLVSISTWIAFFLSAVSLMAFLDENSSSYSGNNLLATMYLGSCISLFMTGAALSGLNSIIRNTHRAASSLESR